MSAARLVKALLLPVVTVGAIAAPLSAASPAAAATCQPDPYNGVCVTPTPATVVTSITRLAVQRTPKTGNLTRYVSAGAAVGVVCQINDGGTADGRTSRTWDALSGGGWVYDAYLTTPAVGTDGFSPGIRHCGTAAPAPTYNAAAYPWPTQDSFVSDQHGYYEAECVSFASWAVRTDGRAHTRNADFLGNANVWSGAYVDSAPHAGDVAQWDPYTNGAGAVGHVAYVAAVNSDGSVVINEYNWGNFHRFNSRTVPANTPSRYLHF
jgi:surface antigen